MRSTFLIAACACVLAACNPSAPAGGDGADSVFPNLAQASYRAEAVITQESGSTMPVVMIRDGGRQRMEMTTSEGQTAIITNAQSGEAFIVTTAGGQTMAMRASAGDYEDPAAEWGGEIASTATRTGSCSVAGQSGTEWTRDGEGAAETVCVTSDGIILRAAEGDRVMWETTSVQRGPQSAALFEVPPGVQVLDMSNMGDMMNQALERAQGGQ